MLAKLLLVEDEKGLALTVTDRLAAEGYAVDHAADGQAGLEMALAGNYQLVILDVMLPRKSGLDVCRAIRQSGLRTPVLMLTARSQVVDKVVGLQIGADDYLTKPFDMLELVARIGALLRRAEPQPATHPDICQFGNVRIDFRKAEARRAGAPVNLSAREF